MIPAPRHRRRQERVAIDQADPQPRPTRRSRLPVTARRSRSWL